MARQYSAKTFLRNVPNALLKEYFDRCGIDLGFRWDMLSETEVNPIFVAMEKLPEYVRSEIDSEFSAISDLARQDGTLAILEEAESWNEDWSALLGDMRSDHERAMWTFLNHPKRFRVAGCLHEMDRCGGWRRRFVGQYLECRSDDRAVAVFEKELQLFYRRQGRGRFCHIDVYVRRDPDRYCYFAYPEDYACADIGYDDHGRFQQRARRSAFEIIFVYRLEEGLLEVSGRSDGRQVAELQEIFGKTILGLVQLPKDGRVPFDLAVLKDTSFSFPTEPKDHVASVHVRLLRFDLPGQLRRRLTVSAETSDAAPRALHQLLDDVIGRSRTPLADLHVSQAKLRFAFEPLNGERPKTLTFDVTYPDRCTLRDDPHDQIAKKYLRRWGIASE